MTAKSLRSAISAAAAFAVFSTMLAACGELTGPESPSTPTNVTAVLLTANSAKITWTPSPLNDGVISYSIFRNGTKVGESTSTDFTDTGLAQQTTYVYSVAANCKGGIVSDRSAETTQSTVTTVDITPPTVVANQPPANFNGVSASATVSATFSEPMDPATINTTTFTLRVTAGGAAIPGTVTYNATTRVATFTATGSLPNPANITATISTGAKDLAGNGLANPFSWAFTTSDQSPPSVIATSPTNGATGVSPSAPITVTFSEAMDAATINTTNITVRTTTGGTAVAGTVTYTAATRTATFTPSAALGQNTGYTVTVSSAVKDVAGNSMTSNVTFAFTTGDTTAPTVTTVVPAPGAIGVALNSTVKVTFSEAMDATTINASTVTLKVTTTSAPVTATVTYDGSTNIATLTPSAPLSPNTSYTVTVTTGARDTSNNGLAVAFASTFITLNPDNTPPTVIAVSPTSGSPSVPTSTTVQVTFSEAMDQSTITTSTITLRNSTTSALVTGTITYDVGTNRATFTPSGPLSNATGYTLTVLSGPTGVKDLAGNALATNFISSFTTSAVTDNTPPTIVSRVPGPDATGVAINSNVVITFNEAMQAATLISPATTITLTPAGGSAVSTTVSCNTPCTTATVDPSVNLDYSKQYTVTVSTAAKDAAGNSLASPATWTFTTEADLVAPTVLVPTSPSNGATNVPITSIVSVTFSEAMTASTINTTSFTLRDNVTATNVSGVVSYNATTHVATFTPNASLIAGRAYTATITTDAKDEAGNPLAFSVSFGFTTAP